MTLTTLTTPNERVSRHTVYGIIAAWLGLWCLAWAVFRPAIFPSPLDVLGALPGLWTEQGLGEELLSSLRVNLEALLLSTGIALPLAYLSRVPVVQPLAQGAAKLRFLSPAAYFVPLAFLTSSGHQLKLAMLVAGEAWFLLTTMLTVVANLPEERYDDARTLRMSEWQGLWFVTIRGTVAEAIEAIRDNAAMGFAALMFVEAIVRSEGGVGVMLVDANKYREFSAVYAIALVLLATGMAQDALIGRLRDWACPYAGLRIR